MSLDRLERRIDQTIREMAEAGELSGLPGEGAPLPTDPDEGAGEHWAARHVMRSASALAPWAALRREIDAGHARLVTRARRHLAWLEARGAHIRHVRAERIMETSRTTAEIDAKVRAEIDLALSELNDLVRRYDLMVPAASLQVMPFTAERVFALATVERGVRG